MLHLKLVANFQRTEVYCQLHCNKQNNTVCSVSIIHFSPCLINEQNETHKQHAANQLCMYLYFWVYISMYSTVDYK